MGSSHNFINFRCMIKTNELKTAASWTNDCQGKQDYDGPILSISTRYWPRGGGYWLVDNTNGKCSDTADPSRQNIRPSATSAIIMYHGVSEECFPLTEKDFEGETEDEVKKLVEEWGQEEMNKIVEALKSIYPKSFLQSELNA